jgi:CMP-N-acetylneuraminic acid synthetase
MRPLVIIPARIGSKGVRRKNFRPLPDGTTLLGRAIQIGRQIGHLVVTTDHPTEPRPSSRVTVRRVGPPLHTDTCAMIDVVRDVLAAVPGPPHQPVVLVQPTAPLRRLADGRRCLAVLARGGDSVCTVTALPARDQGAILTDRGRHVFPTATTRQSLGPRLHVRNGQWYAATRACLLQWGFYGPQWQPIETPVGINIDTLADWRRLCRHADLVRAAAT